jgi:hypothetical protein
MKAPKNEQKMEREKAQEVYASKSTKSFDEVVCRMKDDCAANEGKRCLRCDIMSLEGQE